MKKLISVLRISFLVISISCGHLASSEPKEEPTENVENTQPLSITLEFIRAYDFRLPTLNDSDLVEVFDEAKRIIYSKIGNDIKIEFKDNGTLPLKEFFSKVDYRKGVMYDYFKDWRYDLELAENNPVFDTNDFKERIVQFLEYSWTLESLQKYFPEKDIKDHTQFADLMTKEYHKKIRWLKSLKLENGESLIIEPYEDFQSYCYWLSYMYNQNDYDFVITNTLIINDLAGEPYPHSIFKHAKAGGSSFSSPMRKTLNGRSLMLSIFEEYGGIQGICNTREDLSRKKKNKILGAYLLAHEFCHAFYMIPDVNDHATTCLMHSNVENLDAVEGYEILIKDMTPCELCQPWVVSKKHVIIGLSYKKEKEYKKAADSLMLGAKLLPEKVDGKRGLYLYHLYKEALDLYKKAGDNNGIRESKQALKPLTK